MVRNLIGPHTKRIHERYEYKRIKKHTDNKKHMTTIRTM